MKTGRFLSFITVLGMAAPCISLQVFAAPSAVTDWTALRHAIADGGEIRMDADLTADPASGLLVIPDGVSVSLDLNGHKLQGNMQHFITNYGALTVFDSGENGSITGIGCVIENQEHADLTIKSGSIISEGYVDTAEAKMIAAIRNNGEMRFEGGFLHGKDSNALCIGAQGHTVMSDGKMTAGYTVDDDYYAVCGSGSFEMSGGELTGTEIREMELEVGYDDMGDEFLFEKWYVYASEAVSREIASGLRLPQGKAFLAGAHPDGSDAVLLSEADATDAAKLSKYVYLHVTDAAAVTTTATETTVTTTVTTIPDTQSEWERFQEQIRNSGSYVLEQDLIADARSHTFEIPKGVTVSIDLNGHKIDRDLRDEWDNERTDGAVFCNRGTLTVSDSVGSGMICGGYDHNGGGGIQNFGTLYLYGGCVCENHTDGWNGGGIWNGVDAVLVIDGGEIRNNQAVMCNGGGIANAGTVLMESGVISGNSAQDGYYADGGGVLNMRGASFTMNGGEICGNLTELYGAGIVNQGTLILNGGMIYGNTIHRYHDESDSYTTEHFGNAVANIAGGTVTLGGAALMAGTAADGSDQVYMPQASYADVVSQIADYGYLAWTDTVPETSTTTVTTITTTTETVTETTVTTTAALQQIASDEVLCRWAEKDCQKKHGVKVKASVVEKTDGMLTVALTDADGNCIDTYVIDVTTGIAKNNAAKQISLPQTGNRSVDRALLLLGACMLTGTGLFTIKRSCTVKCK